jgi:hypothetical protein
MNVNDVIKERVAGLSFVDIGGLWGTKNERVTVALAAGARSATMVDYQSQDSEDWRKFHERAEELGFAGQYKSVTANLDDPELSEKIGKLEFVHCSGIIYHAPSPFHTLLNLRAVCQKYLILGSMTVPPYIRNSSGEIDMTDGAAYFIPALEGRKFEIFRSHFLDLGVDVHKITMEYNHPWVSHGEPDYAPWWWLWAPETLAKMGERAGFKMLHILEAWKDRSHDIVFEVA